MDKIDSYLCGLFDGEGWVYLTIRNTKDNRGTYIKLTVGVGMTCRPLVKLFQSRFGGRITTYKDTYCIIHRWYTNGTDTIRPLKTLKQGCLFRKKEVRFALMVAKFVERVKKKRGHPSGRPYLSDAEVRYRNELSKKLKKLKTAC